MPPDFSKDTELSVPLVPWDQFVPRFKWLQGEHVGLIGPTGAGKTNMAFWLLPMRQYITVLATKPRDASLDKFGKRNGYKVLQEWTKATPTQIPRRIIWPNARKLGAATEQRRVFLETMGNVFVQGGWCLYIDELWWVGRKLGLTEEVKEFLQQGRSMDISLVVSSQRPAWIPVEVYDQSSHLFFWRENDERNLSRISGIGWLSGKLIQHTVARLPKYHVLYINTRTGEMMITRPPAPKD